MSDMGEKTCPLCTEEMDFTDQQLKPCKCGYEICVWCWHHVMDMAEKDDTEGRCPACRTPYDKERIVQKTANCERLVAEINLERKQKVQKAKPKQSEGRNHLSNVRVIQRNLVYVIGLPLSLADEELLKRREYFGQYGKVLKVSISRTASGVIQHSSNDSFSVYITYLKEEAAVRCIQSVHNYILEGRSLRACFGTTKYCHSWLKNVPCSNPHCLYLHDFGSQEDCFTKDEIVSAFMRSRVQQIIGATSNLQRCPGNVLPPPADEYNNVIISSTEKPIVKGHPTNIENQVRESVPDVCTGKSSAPPAAASWVTHVSTSWPSVANSSGLTEPGKQKPDTSNGPMAFPPEFVSSKKFECDVGGRYTMVEENSEVHLDGNLVPSESTVHCIVRNCHTTVSNNNAEVITDASPTIVMSNDLSPGLPPSKEDSANIAVPPTLTSSVEFTKRSCSSGPDKDGDLDIDGKFQSLCSGLLSVSAHDNLEDKHSTLVVPNSPISNNFSMKLPGNQCLQQDTSKQHRERFTSLVLKEATTTVDAECVTKEDDSHVFYNQGLKGSEGICQAPSMLSSTVLQQNINESSHHSWQPDGLYNGNTINEGPRNVAFKPDVGDFPFASGDSVLSNGCIDNKANSFTELDRIIGCSDLFPDVGKGTYLGRVNGNVANVNSHGASDMGESHIISNILSLDLDAWDDRLTSSSNFAKLLAETDKQNDSYKLLNMGKVQNSNQSRFLFARQEDLPNKIPYLDHSFNSIRHVPSKCSSPKDFMEDKDCSVDKCRNILSSGSFADSDNISCGHPLTPSNKLSVSRARIPTPPGFSAPSRIPPPGFSSHDRVDMAVHNSSANHLLQTPPLLGGQVRLPLTGNVSSPVDVELNDPAILEVGKGIPTTGLNNTGLDMWQTSSAQLSPFEREARFQLLMQHPVPPAHQNLKLVNHFGNRFSTQNEAYSMPPMLLDQSQGSILSPFAQLTAHHLRSTQSNGHWGSWNGVKSVNNLGVSELMTTERLGFSKLIPGYEDVNIRMPGSSSWNGVKSVNNLGVSELMTTERLGFSKLIPGYEDVNIRMPGSGNLYNREFGI